MNIHIPCVCPCPGCLSCPVFMGSVFLSYISARPVCHILQILLPLPGSLICRDSENKSHSCAKGHGNKAEQDVEQMENIKSLYVIKSWYEHTSAFLLPLPLDQFVTAVRCTCFHAHWHMDDPARWTDWDYETQHALEMEEADPLKDQWQSTKTDFIFHSHETEPISHFFSSVFFFRPSMSCFSHFGNTKIHENWNLPFSGWAEGFSAPVVELLYFLQIQLSSFSMLVADQRLEHWLPTCNCKTRDCGGGFFFLFWGCEAFKIPIG